jgi:branched-chain amino acid transport system permease protein
MDMLDKARAERLWPRPPLWVSALGAAALALLIGYPFIFTTSFSHHLMILILLYALMAQSWNVVAGLSGQISLGQAIFLASALIPRPFSSRNTALRPGRD